MPSGKFSASVDGKRQSIPVKESKPSQILQSDIPQISIAVEKLPSKGLTYPAGSIIQYRPYTFGEIKKISQSKMDTKTSFDFVLKGIETPFDVEDLTLGDFFYLGLLRRISSLGSDKMALPYHCAGCGKVSKYVTETAKLDFDDMEAPELPVQAEFTNGKLIEFMPINLRGVFSLLQNNKFEDEIALLATQCNLPYEEAYNFINNANANDALIINEVDKVLYHSVADIKFKCKEKIDDKECGHQNIIELDGGQALILPFREREESPRSKIHFGKSNARKST